MGQQVSKKEMEELKKETKNKLNKKDILQYHKFWHELFPDGNMDKKGFIKFAKVAMPEAPQDADIDYLFRAMDQNKDGTITFKEFLIFQSITAPTVTPLNPDELIDMAFDMYDEDNDGYVTADEMKESLTNMFKARNLDVTSKEVKNTIEQRIQNLLILADENGDGKLTREEIQKAYKEDPSILKSFNP